MNEKRVLVTGGAGFIGSHIVDALIDLDYNVAVVDNLSTGQREYVHPQAEFYLKDICDESLSQVFMKFRPNIVIHHAAQVDVGVSIRSPSRDAQSNIMGAISVLECCKMAGVEKIIYASSAAVYGMPQTDVIEETHQIKPISFYGISKHTPEHYIQAYSEMFGLKYTILRYSNVYGGRQSATGEGGVVSIFASKLTTDQTPIIYGDGEQTRDFIFVKDVVRANIMALSRGNGHIINVSCNEPTTVNELLIEMCNLSGVRFAPLYKPARPGDIVDSRLDNSLARNVLGWDALYSLSDGLRETLFYYERLKSVV